MQNAIRLLNKNTIVIPLLIVAVVSFVVGLMLLGGRGELFSSLSLGSSGGTNPNTSQGSSANGGSDSLGEGDPDLSPMVSGSGEGEEGRDGRIGEASASSQIWVYLVEDGDLTEENGDGGENEKNSIGEYSAEYIEQEDISGLLDRLTEENTDFNKHYRKDFVSTVRIVKDDSESASVVDLNYIPSPGESVIVVLSPD